MTYSKTPLCFVILLLLLAPLCKAAPTMTTLVPALGWDVSKQGGFPVSLAADAAGNIWVGTEGNGVWKYDAGKGSWTQFTTKDGLGDDCVYTLAFDRHNRLWAGHLNHGVSVYNGDKWQNYGLLDGPIGDRVFAIAVSPKDGDVWIANDMGLARYSEQRQDWDYYTRASGLPSDQIQSLAFDDQGWLYAGTQCNGIAIARPDDNYTKWQTVTAPALIPSAEKGDGLVSDLINDLIAFPLGGYRSITDAATPSGLASTVDASNWAFLRGQDWQQHTAGPYQDGNARKTPLAEDWMTVLRISEQKLWIGYRKSGVELISGFVDKDPEVQANVAGPATVIIRDILALPGQPPLVAAYDGAAGGLLTLANAPPYKPLASGTAAASPPPLPAPAAVPSPDDAKVLGVRLGKLSRQLLTGEAYYFADDWRTQGDWVGRYGGGYAKLCGIAQGDQDYALQPGYAVSLQVGPHHEASEAGPVWYHTSEYSDDLRVLYDPTIGQRRDAEENDVSYDTKTYPESYNGPDLWVRVTVPDGVHCLSLYFLNNDAHHRGLNKYRDYDVQVLPGDGDDAKIQAAAPLARTRVTDFWGGVYKQFLVCGPGNFVVRIGRNRSFVTKLQGVFLDRVAGEPPDDTASLPGFDSIQYDAPADPPDVNFTPLAEAAHDLWAQLDQALGLRGSIPLQMPLRIWCYRAAIAGQAPAALLERWRWQISIWTPDERKQFDDAMKAAHDAIK